MKKIELPIFHHNAHTSQCQNLDLNFNIEDCEIKNMIFFNINAIGIDSQNGKDYGLIFCNGDTFTSSLSYNELKIKILES